MARERVDAPHQDASPDRIKSLRRRVVGAAVILLIIILLIPLLDTEPDFEGYDIALDIPQAPTAPFKPAESASSSESTVRPDEITVVDGEPTPAEETLPAPAANSAVPMTQAEVITPDEEEKRREAQRFYEAERKRLEARKEELQRQEEEKRRLEQKKAEELKKQETEKREAAKREEERREADRREAEKREAAKREEEKREAEKREAEKREAAKREEEKKAEQKRKDAEKKADLQRQLDAEKKAREQSKSEKDASHSGNETDRALAILEGKEKSTKSSKTVKTEKAEKSEKSDKQKATSGKKRYIIQIGAYREEWRMNQLKDKIKEVGLTPFVETTTQNGVTQNRLRVGPFETREAAERGLKRLSIIQLSGPIVER